MSDRSKPQAPMEITREKVLALPGRYYREMIDMLLLAIADDKGISGKDEISDFLDYYDNVLVETLMPFWNKIEGIVENDAEFVLMAFMAGLSALSTGVEHIEMMKFDMCLDDMKMDFLEEDIDNGEQQVEGQEG